MQILPHQLKHFRILFSRFKLFNSIVNLLCIHLDFSHNWRFILTMLPHIFMTLLHALVDADLLLHERFLLLKLTVLLKREEPTVSI